ncbi:hypothetical protein GEMRC1_014092 [Eukaryota sp. GEM-RC1]
MYGLETINNEKCHNSFKQYNTFTLKTVFEHARCLPYCGLWFQCLQQLWVSSVIGSSLFLPSSIIADLLLAFEMTRVMFFSFFVFDKRTCLSSPLHQVLSLARYPIRLPDPLISKKRPISSASISCCFSSLKKFLLLLPCLCRYSLSQCRSF